MGIARLLSGAKSDRFIEQYARQGVAVETLTETGTSPLLCPHCGYAMARMKLPGGSTIETCSAIGLKGLINNAAAADKLFATLAENGAQLELGAPVPLGNLPGKTP